MYTIEKTIKIKNGKNGMVYTNTIANNSVEFTADLPKNAVVDYIEVFGADLGDFNGKSLDEIGIDVDVKYPRAFEFEGQTVAAVVKYPDCPTNEKFYVYASVHNIESFIVHYHEVAEA